MRIAASFLLSTAALGAGTAFAQSLEEVVVTAERRETALQDTPLSIVALSSETLERKGIEELSDVALFTPNLAINGSRGYGNNQPTFSIRGISGGGGATSERGVALYIDGIYVPRTNGSVFKVFDIERIEVLRGPQGTLFGRNSTGGAIRIVTKQPGPEFESYLKATLGNFDRRDISGMVNIPVNDRFSLRAQAAYLNEEGYVKRGSQELGGSEDKLARIQAAFDVTDNVKVTLGGLYTRSESDGSPNVFETFDMAPGIIQGNYADWLSDSLALAGQPRLATNDDPRIVRGSRTDPDFCLLDDFNPDWDEACAQKDNNDYYQADANIVWSLGDKLSLTSISGYAKLDHEGLTDWPLLGMERRPDDVQSKVYYQEFQLNAGLFGGKVDFVTGVNYFGEDSGAATVTINRRGTSVYNGAGGVASPPGVPPNADAGLFRSADTDTTQNSDSFGWFNNLTWNATDKFNVTVGARLAHDKKAIQQTRFPSNGDNWTPAPGTTSTTVNADDSWTKLDWRGTLDYHLTDDVMVYTTASKAYRAGQYSLTVLPNVPGNLQSDDYIEPVPPEEVINYEIGARTTFFNGRLRLNPTGFFMKWSSRQAARQVSCVAEGQASCPIGFRINIVDSGDVDIYGLELDAWFAATENLSFDAGVGITKDDLKDPIANSGPNLFPAQPSPSFNVGATYGLTFSNQSRLAFNVNYAYVGKQETHPTANSDSSYELPKYDLVGARIQWQSPKGNDSVSLFGANLLDETYATYATRFGGGFWDSGSGTLAAAPLRSARTAVRGRPRSFGVTYQHNF
ncbi:MAG: TonB-dependent receptor [Gammaproteobacteria bacterium]